MHVFVTGATGWVGSAVVADLLAAGHRVTGLARSEQKAAALAASGAQVVRASLDDHPALHEAAGAADAVIHTAFDHDFSRFADNAAQDQRVIEVLGSALMGSNRLLLVTSGLSGLPRGGTETDGPAPVSPRRSEAAAISLAERGLRAATVRLAPSVHGIGETHGFVPMLIRKARETGVSAYLADGRNRWSGVHRLDAARLFRLALEHGVTASVYHAVAEEALPFLDIATAIGQRLGLPVEPREREHFGWFAAMAGAEMSASSARTRALLGWHPTGPGLLADLEHPGYGAG
ncbi:SDR family oxidoreductase [Methylobacterium sp. J-030]|uniref:SDR family oxidoreductase n=1 Tax=Methylobacterium sp. J-030 TaxID=2836627 RepID=UPI001FB8B9EA|nr:SDR family oxidoreductase [Methylobacterium sp. J-030]MCJ2074009.1 SDR family oxidoreductase [Methylobacterium sp. J-030]